MLQQPENDLIYLLTTLEAAGKINIYRAPFSNALDFFSANDQLQMYERKLKQKELAKLLGVGEPKLSQIMNRKCKPDIAFLKAAHQCLGIDGNLLLEYI